MGKQRAFTPLEVSRTCLTTVKIRKAQELRAGLLRRMAKPITAFTRHAYGGFTLIELLVVIAIYG